MEHRFPLLVESAKEFDIPMLLWLPAIMALEMCTLAWSEMPAMIPRPVPVP
jgi:hypothetical protein